MSAHSDSDDQRCMDLYNLELRLGEQSFERIEISGPQCFHLAAEFG